MLENIVAQILNRYIGQYVENINTHNLSVGLLQGAVELENLPLKKDALNNLDLPGIILKSGHIGKVVLRIGSYKTIKEPWVIEIHRLRLVVGAGEATQKSDEDAEQKRKDEQKQIELQSLEEKWRARHGQNTSLYSVWYSYSTSIITTIMENLQFEIHDVHVRYEDDKTLLQRFACGICIKNLTAKSTDHQWVPMTSGQATGDKMFKLLQLDGFCIYWDTDAELLGNLGSSELESKLKKWEEPDVETDSVENIARQNKETSQFILTPVCGEAKMMKNSSALPLRSKNEPRISMDVMLGEISLHMSQTQYRQAVALTDEFSRLEKRDVYKGGRPMAKVLESPAAWWRWAGETHLKQICRLRQRMSKTFLLERAITNVTYVKLYEKLVSSKVDLQKFAAYEVLDFEKVLQKIEKDLNFDEIRVLRELVFERVDKELKKKKPVTKKTEQTTKSGVPLKEGKPTSWSSWLGGWGGGWRKKPEESVTAEESEVDPQAEKERPEGKQSHPALDVQLQESVYKDLNEDELYEIFGEELADQDTNDTFLKRDSVLLRLNFKLDAGTMALYESEDWRSGDKKDHKPTPFVGLEFREVSVNTEWRPRYKSSEIKMDLGGLYVRDMCNQRSCFSDLVKPQIFNPESSPHSPRDGKNLSSSLKGIFQLLGSNKTPDDSAAAKDPVFSLLYKNQPLTSTNHFTNRLEIITAPLSITFLPNLVERVKCFFKPTESEESLLDMDDGISAAAREKYEVWKLQSQAEIRRTMKRMMDGKTTTAVSKDRWGVSLNISAPEVILPENVSDPNSSIVIFNLGHMLFKNHNEDDLLSKWKKEHPPDTKALAIEVDDEDDFVTPPATPPSEDSISLSSFTRGSQQPTEEEIGTTGGDNIDDLGDSPSQRRLNEKLLYERMYEKYEIHFTDLQVLVARTDDRWEATRTHGKGPHHLVEKFSVDILTERRIVQTFDPECPAIKVKGNMPHLTIHLNHNKVHSFFKCLDRFSDKSQPAQPAESRSSTRTFYSSKSDEKSLANAMPEKSQNTEEKAPKLSAVTEEKRRSFDEEKAKSKQFLCQFSLNEISVLLEESPTSILSVLDIYRINMEFTKRCYDHCAVFSIHSLLLADTKQELGHDFELLLASHRNVKMDLGSGNLLDSGTVSPEFDAQISSKPSDSKLKSQGSSDTRNTLFSVADNLRQRNIFGFGPEDTSDVAADSTHMHLEEDLITVKWQYVLSGVGEKETADEMADEQTQKSDVKSLKIDEITKHPHNRADIKFNSLDLVLNLKTWVALLDFFHRLKPAKEAENVTPIPYSDEDLQTEQRESTSAISGSTADVADANAPTQIGNEDTLVFLEFRKLNLLLMRHIENGKVIGRKVATLTLHDTRVNAVIREEGQSAVESQKGSKDGPLNVNVDVVGSVGSLGLQDLTNAVRDGNGVLRGMQVLSLGDLPRDPTDTFANSGSFDIDFGASASSQTVNAVYDSSCSRTLEEAFSFTMQKGKRKISSKTRKRKANVAFDSDDLMFRMDSEDAYETGTQEEVILNLHLASVLYMHTPRLVAEVLAIVDEAGDIAHAQMTQDTRQAYKDMAYSIMDKSIAVLGKSVHQDSSDASVVNTQPSSVAFPSLFKLTVDMQTPIVALPKYHGSFELLVGNLGTITVKNGHALGRVKETEEAMDFLHISITDMNVTSKRQVEEEVQARKSPGLARKANLNKSTSGPSLAKLKASGSSKNSSFNEIQILHDTSIRLTVVKKPFVESDRKALDIRNPKPGEDGITPSDEVYDGPISDKKMCVTVQMTLPLSVTLSKAAYEQVLKTLDHISYGGNIDVDGIEELIEESLYSVDTSGSRERARSALDSVASQQSTPSHNRDFKLFTAPGLEITPGLETQAATVDSTVITQRKYTPLYADVSIPQIELQLNGDLSEGEQMQPPSVANHTPQMRKKSTRGVVKVTLEGFSAKFEKENRSTTHLDLTLGSLDIEDLLRDENSPHRHIVSSISRPHQRPGHASGPGSDYLSTSCPDFLLTNPARSGQMSSSVPTHDRIFMKAKATDAASRGMKGIFRPFDTVDLSAGPFGTSHATHEHQTHRSRTVSNESGPEEAGHKKHVDFISTPPCSPENSATPDELDETLVRIRAFLVDGKAAAYGDIYDRTNRRIDIDFNSLDCKINLQTWVVLLDFFGIGTSPKKTYELDRQTEEEYTWDRRLAVSSYYENQPDAFINSEIDFKVRSFSLIFNKEEYEFVKANISKFGTHVQIRDGTLGVSGRLGSLSVSDLSPNGERYRERFVFAGEKAMDFDVKKYDEYDHLLQREFDIRVKLRMSAICYVHTQRFQQELIAYLQHFQQLQEVLGRMRAASVGQPVRDASCRQARVLLDIAADSPVLLIPESSHSDRLVVADLGQLTVKNSFKWNGDPGTLSREKEIQFSKQENPDTSAPLSPGSRRCLLDVIHADLEQMDLFTAVRSNRAGRKRMSSDDNSVISFSSFVVTRDGNPLLKEKCKLSLQVERNLDKETMVRNVPDTSVSGQLSSVYCTVDFQQYWLVRGILDHNLGEPIPEFPQPTAFLQPSDIQTVLSGSVYTGMSIDMNLLNVSVELLQKHKTATQKEKSLARLDYVKSRLSYRSFSDQTKTVNLSCEAFVASDTRWSKEASEGEQLKESRRSVFTTVFGPTKHPTEMKEGSHIKPSKLQFELQFRDGPDFMHFTALLVEMRVYIILDWLSDVYSYIIVNPDQPWWDSLRAKSVKLLEDHQQVVPRQEQQEDDPDKRDAQFKLNVTNTDFVLMEDSSRLDSDAIILRMTAVLHHCPNIYRIGVKKSNEFRKIMNCTLQRLEVFSCQLDHENDTALSIVDPVTVNMEVDALKQNELNSDEINFDPSLLDKNKLDVQIGELNTRVSYNDLLLFLAIAKSLPIKKNVEKTKIKKSDSKKRQGMDIVFAPPEDDIAGLCELGFSRIDVISALRTSGADKEEAAEWLLENAKVVSENEMKKKPTDSSAKIPFNIGKLFMHVDAACVCLIDDCAENCDVPLAELAVRSLVAEQNLSFCDPKFAGPVPCYGGKANFILTGDYYNRMLSLWEPYLEPWRCGLKWNYLPGQTTTSVGKWDVKVQASDRLDISVTSTLIETVKKTMDTWTASFNRSNNESQNLIDLGPTSSKFTRKRQPFVPYVLRNLTGLPLKFATHLSVIQKLSGAASPTGHSSMLASGKDSWLEVLPGDSHSFKFHRAEKQRHKRSERIVLHQIVVKVGNWETLPPVTVSKVGVYFRHATEEISKSSNVYRPPDPVRVVFAVTLEGSAQKVITVRSALVIRSKVKVPVQIQLVESAEDDPIVLPLIEPGGVQYIPLQLTACGIKVKPVFGRNVYSACKETIHWGKMRKDMDSISDIVTCPAEAPDYSEPFRFSVCIKKKKYPSYEEVAESLMTKQHSAIAGLDSGGPNFAKLDYIPPHMPGHTIVILPPVVVSNLLPCDMHYYFKNTAVAGKLSPGQDATLHTLQLKPGSREHAPLLLGCGLEGFKDCRELNITHLERNSQMRMCMLDHRDRSLILNVRVFWRLGCSVKISVMSGYWIVNKTGLPIIVKQEGARVSSAGQYEEHERARSMTPLLFSYSDKELPYLCTMRLGRLARQEVESRLVQKHPHAPSSTSYCQSFSIDGGTCTRNLTIDNHDNSPRRVYYIGVGVRRGWGRYTHTHIVTLAPRFLLVNLTKEKALSFAQFHATSFTDDAAGLNRHLTILPGSSIVFHWPRADLDLLLCARLADEKHCRWSGGFVIDRIDAFHVHLRVFGGGTKGNHSVFLRVEITLVDATYRVTFYDGDISSCPPPLRVDNISAAPLVLKQVDSDEGLTIEVGPSSQVPYACDEPCLPPVIDFMVKGGSISTSMNMDNIGEEKVLYYENFIYIVLGPKPHDSYHQDSVSMRDDEPQYVLEVQQENYDRSVDGHRVILAPRRAGKRSQLWRMTSEGYLKHEGSSPPTAGKKYPHSSQQGMVLDINEMRMGQTDILPLTVRNIDPNRRTQKWTFTNDGRLCCGLRNLCVQVSKSNLIGIGQYTEGGVATPNQRCRSEKMIAGSGVLSLKVVRDGPTRVVRVVDIKQKRVGLGRDVSTNWSLVLRPSTSRPVDPDQFPEAEPPKPGRMNLSIDMAKGIGVSLISNAPEELTYLTMSGVRLEAALDEKSQKFGLKIQRVQIDNQLLGGRPPVMLHPYRSTTASSDEATNSSSTDPTPALSVEALKLPSTNSLYAIYNSLSVNIGRMCLLLEEKLLLKLIQFFSSGFSPETDLSLLDETKMDLIQNTNMSDIIKGTVMKRYYFDSLSVKVQPMQLSVFTVGNSRLDPELKAVKHASSLVLIQFERAPVVMQAYIRQHVFETTAFIVEEAKKHFTDQLKGQAARILGSVDFLGNPIGLMSDLKAGVGSLVGKGSVPSLVKHITHGLSDSAAKVTGSLSAISGGITMDEDHEEKRRMIRAGSSNNPGDHLVSGLHGLAAGLVGGLTSIVTQTVRGATDEGAKGFFTGFGKGLVGTVTKPVTGVLDFASETASFVRDTSMNNGMAVKKARLPRACHSFQGCLECFSRTQADYQSFLHSLNGYVYDEWLYSVIEIAQKGMENMLVLITNKKMYLAKKNDSDPEGILLKAEYTDLIGARPDVGDRGWFVELAVKMNDQGSPSRQLGATLHYSTSSGAVSGARFQGSLRKPWIVCHSESTAKRICEHVNYAKMLASEQSETLSAFEDDTESDKAFDMEV